MDRKEMALSVSWAVMGTPAVDVQKGDHVSLQPFFIFTDRFSSAVSLTTNAVCTRSTSALGSARTFFVAMVKFWAV